MTDDRSPTNQNTDDYPDRRRSQGGRRAPGSASPAGTSQGVHSTASRRRKQPQTRAKHAQRKPDPRNMPPPGNQPDPHYHTQRPVRRGTARARRNSGLYLPLWSLAAMVCVVIMAVVAIVLLVLSMGGNEVPETIPIVIVSSPIPTARPDSFPISPATATIPPMANIILTRPPVTFSLSGPTLAPPPVTVTPQRITVGGKIIVVDVGVTQLNVRDTPGVIDTAVLFRTEEGTIFTIVDGPQQADGLTWWKIQDPANPTLAGWAASNYLEALPEQ